MESKWERSVAHGLNQAQNQGVADVFVPMRTFCAVVHVPWHWCRRCFCTGVVRSGVLRTQKLKTHSLRTQSSKVHPFKPGAGLYIAMHATPTARDFPLANFALEFFLCWLWLLVWARKIN